MNGINKVILVGTLGRDPEESYTPSGTAVAKFSVATSERWTDKNSGDKKEKTEWHRVTAFGKLGEICSDFLSKGSKVYIEGKLQYGSYEKDGITRYTTDIIASQMQMLDSKYDNADIHKPADCEPNPPEDKTSDEDIPF